MEKNMSSDNEPNNNFEGIKHHPAVLAACGTTLAGAGIGSIIPVVGTAIGAGVGAIIGGAIVIANEVNRRNKKKNDQEQYQKVTYDDNNSSSEKYLKSDNKDPE